MTRVANTRVVHLTEYTSFANRTFTYKGCNSVVAGGSMHAGCTSTIIYVLTTVVSTPAIDTDAVIASVDVEAGPSILTGIWLQLTLIHIFCTKLTCPLRCASAVVGVHSIHTDASILTFMFRAVINVCLTVFSTESWQAVAFVGQVITGWPAGASVNAGRWRAGDVNALTVGSSEARLA